MQTDECKPRLWVLTELYHPELTSTGYFLTRIAESLASHLEVNVICSQPTYASRGVRVPPVETRNGVHITRCRGTRFDKDFLPLRLLNIISITLSIFIKALVSIRRGEVVLAVTNPPALPFAAAIACWIRGARFFLLVHDVYPDALVCAGLLHRGSPLVWLIGRFEALIYSSANRIVVIGRDMKELLETRVGRAGSKIVVIRNWADSEFVQPAARESNRLLMEIGLLDKFVIQYSGNIGRTHGIEHLVDCSQRFTEQAGVHFLFIGFGGKKEWLAGRIKEGTLNNATLIDYLPRSDLPVSLNACDIAVISFCDGMAGVSVPSRMYNIMAAGKPIIALTDTCSELARVISEENIGWVVAPGDVSALCEIIKKTKGYPGLLADMGRRARKAAEAKYSLDRVKRAYLDLIS